jgi:hypothetical protein
VILKNKYSIIRFMCGIATIILAICYFIGNIDSKKLTPFILINLLVLHIFDDKENNNSGPYTKYDCLKIILSCILFFWITIIVITIFHHIISQ